MLLLFFLLIIEILLILTILIHIITMPILQVLHNKMSLLSNYPLFHLYIYTSSKLIKKNEATHKPNNYPIEKVNVIRLIYLPLTSIYVISDNIVTPQGEKNPTNTPIMPLTNNN